MDYYSLAQYYQYLSDELLQWSNISKEHTTFLLAVAQLSCKTLKDECEETLVFLHHKFANIEREIQYLQQNVYICSGCYQNQRKLSVLLHRFSQDNEEFIKILRLLLEETLENKEVIWEIMLKHILDEQQYMANIFNKNIYY